MKVKDSHKLWNIPKGKKIMMEHNGTWQPIGKNRCKFRRLIGKIVRSSAFVRILDNWKKVPQATKDDIWSSLMVCVN
jgi:hypothetical protein